VQLGRPVILSWLGGGGNYGRRWIDGPLSMRPR